MIDFNKRILFCLLLLIPYFSFGQTDSVRNHTVYLETNTSGFRDNLSTDAGKRAGGFVAVKNNFVADAALIANLGIEIGLGRNFSIDVPVTFSPYDIASDFKLRTLSFQPEFRYYLDAEKRGHFFGAHANVAYYNIVTRFDSRTRYQDHNGNTPLWGFGLSYGYSLPFSSKSGWGIEFTLGLGYARLNYDCFYNIPNGAMFANEQKDYWGITKAGINIYYRFNGRKGGRK